MDDSDSVGCLTPRRSNRAGVASCRQASANDKRIVANATRLTEFLPSFGKFMADGRLFPQDPPLSSFEFYVYRRRYRALASEGLDAAGAPTLAEILGNAIGVGHGHSGARTAVGTQ